MLLVATFLVVAWLPVASWAAPGDASATCLGMEATIVGTSGSDSIEGTSGHDVIAALAGDDRIRGRGGTDVICGGRGSDQIKGHGDLLGGAGDDEIKGTWVADSFYGGPGDDSIHGGPIVDGQGYQPDEVNFTFAAAGVRADLSTQTATGEGTDELHGIEDIYGSPHADVLIGMGITRFVTGGGDDIVIGAGAGYDLLDFRPAPRGIDVDLQAGTGSGWGNLTITGIDNINGSLFGDRLVGSAGRNEIIGDNGTDHLQGGDGRDFLFESCICGLPLVGPEDFQTDGTVRGGPARDWIVGTHGDNVLAGGRGNDFVFGLDGDDLLLGGGGDLDVAHFGGSYDRYYTSEPLAFAMWALDRAVSVDLTAGTAEGQGSDRLSGFEGVLGSDRDDTIVGDGGVNKLWGLGGNDTLSGEGGADMLNGGPFVDHCSGTSEARRVECEQ